MSFPRGLLTSYSIQDNKIHLDDVFQKLEVPETPLLNVVRTGEKLESTVLQWYEEIPVPLDVRLTAAYTAPGNTLTVSNAAVFKVGNIIEVNNVFFRITDINVSNNTLTVAAIGTPTNLPNNARVRLVSDANVEAASIDASFVGARALRENVTQIFKESLELSGTQMEVKQWVRNYDIVSDEIERKLKRLKIMMERSLIQNPLVKPTDNTSPRIAGGIDYFITQYGYVATGELRESNFKAVLEELYNRLAGDIEVWMHPKTKEDFFNQLLYDKVIIDRTDKTVGRTVQRYVCEYGEVPLMTSPHIKPGVIYFFDPKKIEIRPLRPFAVEELARTGDFRRWMIVGEYTFKIENANLMAKFVVS